MQKRASIKAYGLAALLCVAAAIGLNNIIFLVDLSKYSEAYRKAAEILYSPPFAEQILYTGILMPIIEELIFRGVVFKLTRRFLNFVWSMIISAFLFGIYHGNLVQFVYAGLIGLLLAWLYEKFDSIKAPVMAHMLMNIVVCALTKTGGFAWMFTQTVRALVVTALCVAAGCIVFVGLRKVMLQKC